MTATMEECFWKEMDKQPWRPVVAPYRPRSLSRIRVRKPLPGQLFLLGIEPTESRDADQQDGRGHRAGQWMPELQGPNRAVICPNCGGTRFDDDGDCVACWEPGVAKAHRQPLIGTKDH
jgi:hypothetical protein